jgi:hypothetical protein
MISVMMQRSYAHFWLRLMFFAGYWPANVNSHQKTQSISTTDHRRRIWVLDGCVLMLGCQVWTPNGGRFAFDKRLCALSLQLLSMTGANNRVLSIKYTSMPPQTREILQGRYIRDILRRSSHSIPTITQIQRLFLTDSDVLNISISI